MVLMMPIHPLRAAIAHIGLARLARELGVTHQAVRKWEAAGRMPRTEWTRETSYCDAIERLTEDRADGVIARDVLLSAWPADAAGAAEPMPTTEAGDAA